MHQSERLVHKKKPSKCCIIANAKNLKINPHESYGCSDTNSDENLKQKLKTVPVVYRVRSSKCHEKQNTLRRYLHDNFPNIFYCYRDVTLSLCNECNLPVNPKQKRVHKECKHTRTPVHRIHKYHKINKNIDAQTYDNSKGQKHLSGGGGDQMADHKKIKRPRLIAKFLYNRPNKPSNNQTTQTDEKFLNYKKNKFNRLFQSHPVKFFKNAFT